MPSIEQYEALARGNTTALNTDKININQKSDLVINHRDKTNLTQDEVRMDFLTALHDAGKLDAMGKDFLPSGEAVTMGHIRQAFAHILQESDSAANLEQMDKDAMLVQESKTQRAMFMAKVEGSAGKSSKPIDKDNLLNGLEQRYSAKSVKSFVQIGLAAMGAAARLLAEDADNKNLELIITQHPEGYLDVEIKKDPDKADGAEVAKQQARAKAALTNFMDKLGSDNVETPKELTPNFVIHHGKVTDKNMQCQSKSGTTLTLSNNDLFLLQQTARAVEIYKQDLAEANTQHGVLVLCPELHGDKMQELFNHALSHVLMTGHVLEETSLKLAQSNQDVANKVFDALKDTVIDLDTDVLSEPVSDTDNTKTGLGPKRSWQEVKNPYGTEEVGQLISDFLLGTQGKEKIINKSGLPDTAAKEKVDEKLDQLTQSVGHDVSASSGLVEQKALHASIGGGMLATNVDTSDFVTIGNMDMMVTMQQPDDDINADALKVIKQKIGDKIVIFTDPSSQGLKQIQQNIPVGECVIAGVGKTHAHIHEPGKNEQSLSDKFMQPTTLGPVIEPKNTMAGTPEYALDDAVIVVRGSAKNTRNEDLNFDYMHKYFANEESGIYRYEPVDEAKYKELEAMHFAAKKDYFKDSETIQNRLNEAYTDDHKKALKEVYGTIDHRFQSYWGDEEFSTDNLDMVSGVEAEYLCDVINTTFQTDFTPLADKWDQLPEEIIQFMGDENNYAAMALLRDGLETWLSEH